MWPAFRGHCFAECELINRSIDMDWVIGKDGVDETRELLVVRINLDVVEAGLLRQTLAYCRLQWRQMLVGVARIPQVMNVVGLT